MNKKTGVKIVVGAAVLGAIGYGCYILGKHDMFEECNKQCRKMLFYYTQEIENHAFKNLILANPDIKDEVNRTLMEIKLNGKPEQILYHCSLIDGSVRWIEDGVEHGRF